MTKQQQIEQLTAENESLRATVKDYLSLTTQDLHADQSGVRGEAAGNMVRLLAAAIAQWFEDEGGKNFVECRFGREDKPGSFLLTVQIAPPFGMSPAEVASEFRKKLLAILVNRHMERMMEVGHEGQENYDEATALQMMFAAAESTEIARELGVEQEFMLGVRAWRPTQ